MIFGIPKFFISLSTILNSDFQNLKLQIQYGGKIHEEVKYIFSMLSMNMLAVLYKNSINLFIRSYWQLILHRFVE